MDRIEQFVADLQKLMRDQGVKYIHAEGDVIAVVSVEGARLGSFLRIHQRPEDTF